MSTFESMVASVAAIESTQGMQAVMYFYPDQKLEAIELAGILNATFPSIGGFVVVDSPFNPEGYNIMTPNFPAAKEGEDPYTPVRQYVSTYAHHYPVGLDPQYQDWYKEVAREYGLPDVI